MSKEKQIEEMTEIIKPVKDYIMQGRDTIGEYWIGERHSKKIAHALYNAGYRKQSEGEWIQVAAYNDGVLNTVKCSVCGTYQMVNYWMYYPHCMHCGAKMKEGRGK